MVKYTAKEYETIEKEKIYELFVTYDGFEGEITESVGYFSQDGLEAEKEEFERKTQVTIDDYDLRIQAIIDAGG